MIEDDRNSRFSEVVLPHLPDALTTALWLTGNRTDAEDVVQETIAADLANYDFGAGHDPADFIQIGGIATNNDPFFATVNNNVLAAGGRLSQFDRHFAPSRAKIPEDKISKH